MSVNRRKRGYDGSLTPIQPQTFVYSMPNKGLKRLKKVFVKMANWANLFFIEKRGLRKLLRRKFLKEVLDVPF